MKFCKKLLEFDFEHQISVLEFDFEHFQNRIVLNAV